MLEERKVDKDKTMWPNFKNKTKKYKPIKEKSRDSRPYKFENHLFYSIINFC